MRTLTSKETLIELLRSLDEVRTGWDTRSRGDGPVLMPSMYHEGSYSELERRLAEMREGGYRREWWHVSYRHRWGVERRRSVPVRRTRFGPEPVLNGHCELLGTGEVNGKVIVVNLYEWSDEVDEEIVGRGLTRLLATMYDGDVQRLQLPLFYLYRAMGLPPPDERPTGRRAKVSSATGSSALSSEEATEWTTPPSVACSAI